VKRMMTSQIYKVLKMKKLILFMLVFSFVLAGFVSADICLDTIGPEASTGLSTSGNVLLTWNEAIDRGPYEGCSASIDYYDVYRDDVLVGSVVSTSYSDGSLADGTYVYSVVAFDTAEPMGNEGLPATISVTIGGDEGSSSNNNNGDGGGGGGGDGTSNTYVDLSDDGSGDNFEEEGEDENIFLEDNSPRRDGFFSWLTGAVIGEGGGAKLGFGVVVLAILVAIGYFVVGIKKKA